MTRPSSMSATADSGLLISFLVIAAILTELSQSQTDEVIVNVVWVGAA